MLSLDALVVNLELHGSLHVRSYHDAVSLILPLRDSSVGGEECATLIHFANDST